MIKKIKNLLNFYLPYKDNAQNIIKYSKANNYIDLKNFDKKVSIVIITFNRLDDIKRCVNSLYENVSFAFDLLILDNGSD